MKASGFDKAVKRMEALERAAADEKAFRAEMKESVQPIAVTARSIVRRLSGRTAEDIAVRDVQSKAGEVVLAIGGSTEKYGRGYIARFLEEGVLRRLKGLVRFPFLQPAYDADNDGWKSRLLAGLRARFGAVAK